MTGYPNWFPSNRCDYCGYNAKVSEMTDGTLICYVCFYDEVEE
jgi:formylmethanofuran dehydrogenase subunit E